MKKDYLVYSVFDKVTDSAKEKGIRIYACEIAPDGIIHVLSDWEFLKVLNMIRISGDMSLVTRYLGDDIFDRCESAVIDYIMSDEFAPKVPVATLSGALLRE